MGEFILPIRVYYDDTDSLGMVYHANYLKYFERARTEWLREKGYEVAALNDKDMLLVVAKMEITYRRSARLSDELEIVTRLANIAKASVVFEQEARLKGKTEILCHATVKVANVNRDGRPQLMPTSLQKEMQLW